VFGIAAGSLLGGTLGRIFTNTLQPPYDVYGPFLVAPLVAGVLVYVAVKFSAGLETTTKVYQLVIGADSFAAVVTPALMELQKRRDDDAKELQEKLTSVMSVMGSKAVLLTANIQALRNLHQELVKKELAWHTQDTTIQAMLAKLIAMLNTLQSVPIKISEVCEENMKLVFKDERFHVKASTEKKSIRVTARKGRLFWSRVAFRLDFSSNIDNSLLIPVNCTVTAYPLGDFMEHRKFEESIDHLLSAIESKKEFQEIGIEFVDLEKSEFWGSMKEMVGDPLLRQIHSAEERILEQLENSKKGP
jgi:hypothetical protein